MHFDKLTDCMCGPFFSLYYLLDARLISNLYFLVFYKCVVHTLIMSLFWKGDCQCDIFTFLELCDAIYSETVRLRSILLAIL